MPSVTRSTNIPAKDPPIISLRTSYIQYTLLSSYFSLFPSQDNSQSNSTYSETGYFDSNYVHLQTCPEMFCSFALTYWKTVGLQDIGTVPKEWVYTKEERCETTSQKKKAVLINWALALYQLLCVYCQRAAAWQIGIVPSAVACFPKAALPEEEEVKNLTKKTPKRSFILSHKAHGVRDSWFLSEDQFLMTAALPFFWSILYASPGFARRCFSSRDCLWRQLPSPKIWL